MRFRVRKHFDKADTLIKALVSAGHEEVRAERYDVDFFLTDLDYPGKRYGYIDQIERYKAHGAKVFMYPHGGGLFHLYDGHYEPSRKVDANFVHGRGQANVLRRLKYPQPVHVIGWSLSEIREFEPREPKHVLFAPSHPGGDGSMRPEWREANSEIFRGLLETDLKVTVRMIGTHQQNGLPRTAKAKFTRGHYFLDTADMQKADVVVAGVGTFPTMSVALGIPTVFYGQDLAPDVAYRGAPTVELSNPEAYMSYASYPLEALSLPLDYCIRVACAGNRNVERWKKRFVGKPFDPERFVTLVKRLVVR